jgi:hypothetical protein
MGALAAYQRAFAAALFEPDRPMPAAFSVYRNTVMKGCVDALQANYPAVARLTGEEWFRAAAAVYVRARPPRVPMLQDYGADLAEFLARFEPAAGLPYLPAVARLDRYWTEAHAARNERPLGPDALAGLAPEALAAQVLRPHGSARWAWFDLPAYTIWSRNRQEGGEGDDQGDIEWRPEGALLARPGDSVHWIAMEAAGCAFLDACAAGETLAQAADRALAADAKADVAGLLARLLGAGAFAQGNDRGA